MQTRREFLKCAGLAAAAGALGATGSGCRSVGEGRNAAGVRERPNIIFVLADDLGYGDLGCYGQKTIRTPNLDRMAAEGMIFTDHYSGTCVCAPSRCSLMTGLHTGHTYIRGNSEVKPMGQLPLPEGTVTLARVLQGAGYRTALVGKWGLGGPDSTGVPNRQGFDSFFGYLCQRHAHNYYPEFLFRNGARVPLKNEVPGGRADGAGVATKKVEYSASLFEREALQFIEQNKGGPFLLYFAATLPHANDEGGQNGMEVPDYGVYTDKNWPEPEKGRAAMITYLDRSVGRLVQRVKDLDLDRNTIVFFASDNGPHREGGSNPEFLHCSGPLRGIKRDLYEGGVRVPMIARWPGRIKPGTQTGLVSAFWDVLPTCAELAGAPCPGGLDGISMVPTLLGRPEQQRQHEALYWEFHEGGSVQGVRMGRWKAVRPVGKKLELYDLQTDLGEKDNVAEDHSDVVARIEKYLATARTESEFWPLKAGKK